MVMIPVGNRTRHNFSMWTFGELFVRLTITACVYAILEINTFETAPYWFIVTLFGMWILRPLYIQIKHLFYSWRDAKHQAESDALSEKSE